MKKLAVITVNYNNYKITEKYLEYFNDQENYHIFIVDLSSTHEAISHPDVTQIFGENKGYAHGINLGMQKAYESGYDQFVVMNNDTRVTKTFVADCLKSLQKHPCSLIGGKIYYEKGYEYHKKYKQNELGNVFWYAGGIIDWNNIYVSHRGVDEVDHGQYDTAEKTDFITGCLMLYDKCVIEKIGKWNTDYFLYFEDTDFCEKAKNAGISLYFDPEIQIWHLSGQSTGGAASLFQQKYLEKNRIKFGLKYAPLRTKIHLIKNSILSVFKIE